MKQHYYVLKNYGNNQPEQNKKSEHLPLYNDTNPTKHQKINTNQGSRGRRTEATGRLLTRLAELSSQRTILISPIDKSPA